MHIFSVGPTLIEGPSDQILIINSTTARYGGGLVTFRCIVDSQPQADITWSYADGNISDPRISVSTSDEGQGRQRSILTFMYVKLSDQGRFTCNVESPYGNITSTATLSVFGKLGSSYL